jgi:hypothetical protein
MVYNGYQSLGDPHLLALEFLVAPEDLHQLDGEFAFPPTDCFLMGFNGNFMGFNGIYWDLMGFNGI